MCSHKPPFSSQWGLDVMSGRVVGVPPPAFPGAGVLPALYSLLSSWRSKNRTKLTHCRQHRVHWRTGEWREAFQDGWTSRKWSGPARGVTFTPPEKRLWCVHTGSKRQAHLVFIPNLKRPSPHTDPMLPLRKCRKATFKVWYFPALSLDILNFFPAPASFVISGWKLPSESQ